MSLPTQYDLAFSGERVRVFAHYVKPKTVGPQSVKILDTDTGPALTAEQVFTELCVLINLRRGFPPV